MRLEMNKTFKKIKNIALILIGFAILYLLISFPIALHNSKIDKTHSATAFLEQTYTSYNGGIEAKVFFDEYAYVDNYKDIAFNYVDGEKYIGLYNHFTVFALDVYYDEIDFLEISDTILSEITGQTAKEFFITFDGKRNVAFSGCKVEKGESVYEGNNASILFDPRYNTIRYVFFCNDSGTADDARYATIRTLNLKENKNKDDWIFDYSDIIPKDHTDSY